MLSAFMHGECDGKHRGNDGEVFCDVVRDGEGGQRAARHQELLADLDDLDQLGRIRIEVDHVAGFLRRLCSAVHGDADIGLSKRGRVVRTVSGHRNQFALGLLALDQIHLVFWFRLCQEIVDAGFPCNRGSGQRVIARDHHGPYAHGAQLRKALFHAAFDNIFQVDNAERAAILRDHQRSTSATRNGFDGLPHLAGTAAALIRDIARSRRQRPCE